MWGEYSLNNEEANGSTGDDRSAYFSNDPCLKACLAQCVCVCVSVNELPLAALSLSVCWQTTLIFSSVAWHVWDRVCVKTVKFVYMFVGEVKIINL